MRRCVHSGSGSAFEERNRSITSYRSIYPLAGVDDPPIPLGEAAEQLGQKLDFPISRASLAVSIALDEKRWAVTVRVDNGVPGEVFVFGRPATKSVARPGGVGSKAPVRGAESLIVNGVLRPIRDERADGGGARPLNNPYQIVWSGGELAVTCSDSCFAIFNGSRGVGPRTRRIARTGSFLMLLLEIASNPGF